MAMYRYIVLLWARANSDAANAAKFIETRLYEVSPHAWRNFWRVPGIAVFDSGESKGRMQSYQLSDDGGVVLGRIFRKDYASQIDDFSRYESKMCLSTKGQYLVSDYWGRYVSFLNDRGSDTRFALRDPTGAFPCFYTSFRNVEIYFSDIQDVAKFEFLRFTINWDCIRTNIMLPLRPTIHTGLQQVGEVLPAECVEITPFARKSRFLWNPMEIATTGIVRDAKDAARGLRSTVRKTIGALASCYDRVIHNLGGLDSSIALACLSEASSRPEITCITNFTKSPRGDERFYSRQVAKWAGVRLVESELEHRRADLTKLFKANRLASPLGFFDCIGLIGDVHKLASERQAQAIFYGVGGDQVLFHSPRMFGALDYVQKYGVGKDILKVAVEASRYGQKSLPYTFKEMLKERFIPSPCYEYVYRNIYEKYRIPLVNPEFIGERNNYERFLHPLLIPDGRMAKGKYLHILSSAFFSIEYYDHWDSHYVAERIDVFLSQPIIEVCLRIPTWILTYGGIDRGLARKAFCNDLPPDIIKRTSKSTPGPYYRDLFERNIRLIKEVLLDGVMVREKVLVRGKLERTLARKDPFLLATPIHILGYLATEVWLRSWLDRDGPRESDSVIGASRA